MKKSLVIIAARDLGDLIYHLPLLRSLYESYREKLIIISNKVNHSKEIYKHETFYEIMQVINSCDYIVGNESGPVCLGTSLKKEVHSIYIPIHAPPESKIINNNTYYYNTEKENDETIINKIVDRVVKDIR